MKWTFGIITDGKQHNRVRDCISSIYHIKDMPLDKFEVIVIGGSPHEFCYAPVNEKTVVKNYKHVPFDENIKRSWITRKKNMIAENARYPNLSIAHDYVTWDENWYKNAVLFGEDWDVCMNRILNTDGKRFRDWVTWDGGVHFIPYTEHSKTKHMYVSGSYFCVKKNFLLAHRLDETKIWGQAEDVDWSKFVRNFWNYKCNPASVVRFIKEKPHHPPTPE